MKKILSIIIIIFCLAAYCNCYAISNKPIIGISCSNSEHSSSLSKSYSDAVSRAGGIAVMIPVSTDSLTLRATIKLLDGIILSGGGDIHPSYFGERPIEELNDYFDEIEALGATEYVQLHADYYDSIYG